LNKTELVAAIAADTNLSKVDAARAFDSALEHLAGALAKPKFLGHPAAFWPVVPFGINELGGFMRS
jgi:hypothetical protein